MGDAQLQPTYPRGITFEQVWADLMETRKNQEETARQIKDINKRFGEYSNRLGEISEYMIAPQLKEKFNELGFDFEKTSKNIKVKGMKHHAKRLPF